MSNVIHRTTLERKLSVNTPDFPVGTWIINPDLTSLGGVAEKYWKISGDNVLEMNQTEKDVVDAAEVEANRTDASGIWSNAAPANDTEAINRMAAALKAINGPIE